MGTSVEWEVVWTFLAMTEDRARVGPTKRRKSFVRRSDAVACAKRRVDSNKYLTGGAEVVDVTLWCKYITVRYEKEEF